MTNPITQSTLRANIETAFGNVYPDLADHTDGIIVEFRDDETILVELEGQPSWLAYIDSDDDGYLRFGLYDPDYSAEYPDEDHLDPVSIRVKAF